MQDAERMPEAPEESAEDMEEEPKPSMKRRKTLVVAGCAVAVALAAGGIAFAATHQASQPDTPEAQASKTAATGDGKDAKGEETSVTVRVEAEGWAEDSTPVIVHVKGGKADSYRAVEPNADATLKLAPGDYELEWVSPINSDGSIYDTGDAAKVKVAEGGAKVSATFERIEAADATPEQVEAVLESIREAVEKGGSSIADGAAIVEKAEANAAKGGKVDGGKPAAEGKEARQEATGEQSNGTAGSNTNVPSNAGNSNGGGSSSAGNTAPTPAPEPAPAPQPQHQHSPRDVYRTETYVITPAQTTSRDYLLASDGSVFYDTTAGEYYCTINDLSYSIKTEVNTIPAVTGTHDVYDHTECSTCGARL